MNSFIPRGSALYYSLLFTEENKRTLLTTIEQFYNTLWKIIIDIEDPNIARTKLGWWREEILRLSKHENTQHPIINSLKKLTLPEKFFFLALELINGLESLIDFPLCFDEEDFKKRIKQTVEIKTRLYFLDTQAPTWVTHYAIGIERLQRLTSLAYDIKHDKCFFPKTTLDDLKIAPHHFVQTTLNNDCIDWINKQLNQSKHNLNTALESMPKTKSYSFFHIQAKIALAVIQKGYKKPAALINNQISLTPIRMLFLALLTRHE